MRYEIKSDTYVVHVVSIKKTVLNRTVQSRRAQQLLINYIRFHKIRLDTVEGSRRKSRFTIRLNSTQELHSRCNSTRAYGHMK